MLRRLGNKKKILPHLLPLFPECKTFIDMFMGTGSVSFAMIKRCNYVFANDIENEIFNLYQVLKNDKDELIKQLQIMPVHNGLFQHWRHNKESEAVMKAVRFLFLSNFGYMGVSEALRFGMVKSKKILLNNIEEVFRKIQNVQFLNYDFREVLKKIEIKNIQNAFLYCDPPYLNTTSNYNSEWKLQDTEDLFQICMDSGLRFAISEFENPIIVDMAKSSGLKVNHVIERKSLRNRNNEILITNYSTAKQRLLFYGT